MKIIDKNDLLNALEKFKTIKSMVAGLKTSQDTLKESFKFHNIQYPNFRKVAFCDENFFKIINEKSLYWAGFLAADGNLRHRSSYSIKLELATADRDHIELFKKDTKSDANIYDAVRSPSKLLLDNKSVKKEYHSSYFVINSKKMYEDLALYNIVPRKTYIYEMPEWLTNHKNINHFIRGYIDGDGSFSFNKRNDKVFSIKLSLNGASNVVKQIYDILCNKCNTKYGAYNFYNDKSKTFYFNSLIDLDRIITFLYSDAETYLERKFLKANEIKKLIEKSILYNFDPIELQKLYNELGSFNKVAKYYNCSRNTVRYQMHNMGLNYKENPEMSRR